MDPNIIAQLQVNRVGIAADWMREVMAGPSGNPLAEPETMVHLVVPALERIMAQLGPVEPSWWARLRLSATAWPPACQCDRNPFRDFYVRGEGALLDNVTVQRLLGAGELAELQTVFRTVAMEDICSFDSVYQGKARMRMAGAR